MLKMIIITVLVAGVIASMLGLTGCHHLRKPEKRADWIKDKITDELDLNDSQENLLDEIWSEFAQKHKELKPDHDKAKQEMIEALGRPELDVTAINRKIDEKIEIFRALSARFVDRMAEFHRTLNPEQREKLIAWVKKHHEKRRKCAWHH